MPCTRNMKENCNMGLICILDFFQALNRCPYHTADPSFIPFILPVSLICLDFVPMPSQKDICSCHLWVALSMWLSSKNSIFS